MVDLCIFTLQYVGMETLICEKHLVDLVEQFAANHGREVGGVSILIFNDANRIKNIKNGSSLRVDTFNNAIAWLSDHWGDYPWVEGIPRPKPREIHTTSLTHASNGVY